MHEFNNGKYDETRTGEVINEMSTMSKEIGWPVVVMDTLEYYAGSADDEVLEMDLAVKRHMDRGLTPDEWAVAQAVREATQAALHSMDNMAK